MHDDVTDVFEMLTREPFVGDYRRSRGVSQWRHVATTFLTRNECHYVKNVIKNCVLFPVFRDDMYFFVMKGVELAPFRRPPPPHKQTRARANTAYLDNVWNVTNKNVPRVPLSFSLITVTCWKYVAKTKALHVTQRHTFCFRFRVRLTFVNITLHEDEDKMCDVVWREEPWFQKT